MAAPKIGEVTYYNNLTYHIFQTISNMLRIRAFSQAYNDECYQRFYRLTMRTVVGPTEERKRGRAFGVETIVSTFTPIGRLQQEFVKV